MPKLEEWEIKKYWQIFNGLKPVDNKLSSEQVKPVMTNSKLPQEQLSQIWSLADIDLDGSLDFEEFVICMRLLFDMINGNIDAPPASLPQWLVPASKTHLVNAQADVSRAQSGQAGAQPSAQAEPEPEKLFDWYIDPESKTNYEKIYSGIADVYGRISFEALEHQFKGDLLSQAWNLVNPKQGAYIDKDQALYLLHIVLQCQKYSIEAPTRCPTSLRSTFHKDLPNYDLSTVKESKEQKPEQYTYKKVEGTDFSATEGTDWELVRLQRELQALEQALQNGQQSKVEVNSGSGLVKYQLEQVLKYKTQQLASTAPAPGVDADLDTLEQQVGVLENYLKSKRV